MITAKKFIGAGLSVVLLAGCSVPEATLEQSSQFDSDTEQVEKSAEEVRKPIVVPKPEVKSPAPTPAPKPTPKVESKPVTVPTTTPTPVVSKYSCAVEKTCGQMTSCEEAYYHLTVCGYSKRDGDDDGVPCEDIC